MKEKLTLQDIVDLLAKKTGLSKKDADAFFREFFAVIADNVFNNEPVRIKDFGTFKLTRINSRESVDVNTGEKIEIPAHYKLSFLPDKSLKTLVNKPFAHFETTLLEEGVSFESIEETDEPVDNQEEEDTSIEDKEPVVKETAEENKLSPEDSDTAQPVDTEKKDAVKNQPVEKESGDEKEKTEPEAEQQHVEPSATVVYTLNYKIAEDASISVSAPVNILQDSPVAASEENAPEEQPETAITEDTILPEQEEKPQKKLTETGDGLKTPPIEVNKVQEKIDQLKEAIEALKKKEPAEDLQEKVDEEEDTTAGKESAEKESQEPPAEETLPDKDKKRQIEENAYADEKSGDDSLEKMESVTLNNARNISYSSFKDVDEKKVSSMATIKEGVDESPDEIRSDEEYMEEEYQFTDYYKETPFSRFRKKLPVIFILLILIGIGAYQFYSLFNTQQVFPSYKEYHRYIASDTLVIDSEIMAMEDSLKNLAGQDVEEPQDTLLSGGNEPVSLPTVTEPAEESPVPADSVFYERIISDNLKIKVVNKAAHMRERNLSAESDDNHPAIPEKDVRDVVREVVQQGSTFRSIATKYYGSGEFWVYIYEENKNKIPDYDNLLVGVVLTIPPLEKYGISLSDPHAKEKAKEREISLFNSRRRYP